jgi:Aldehyde dehydrogenase family
MPTSQFTMPVSIHIPTSPQASIRTRTRAEPLFANPRRASDVSYFRPRRASSCAFAVKSKFANPPRAESPQAADGEGGGGSSHAQEAKGAGARVLTGGGRPPNLPRGYFVQPTVFTGVTPDMRIWQEEIFGPVLAIVTFRTEQEAVRIANDTPYGLGGAVCSADPQVLPQRALRKYGSSLPQSKLCGITENLFPEASCVGMMENFYPKASSV